MRVLVCCTHTDQITGYGKVANALLTQMATVKDIELFHFGFQRHPTFRRAPIQGLTQFEASSDDQGFDFKGLRKLYDLIKPDVVFIYNDPLVVNRFMDVLPAEARVWVYLDQVYRGIALSKIEKAEKVFVFSEAWRTKPTDHVLQHAPFIPSAKPKHLHDGKIFLNINRNSERKRHDIVMQAWALHAQAHPEDKLIVVTGCNRTTANFFDIGLIAQVEKMDPKNIQVIDTDAQALKDEEITSLMAMADYGVNASDGEGCGLMNMDMAALGKPQIVHDIGSYRDFLTDADSVLIKPTIRTYMQNVGIGIFRESALVSAWAAAFEEVKTKSAPNVDKNWRSVTEELRKLLKGGEAVGAIVGNNDETF